MRRNGTHKKKHRSADDLIKLKERLNNSDYIDNAISQIAIDFSELIIRKDINFDNLLKANKRNGQKIL